MINLNYFRDECMALPVGLQRLGPRTAVPRQDGPEAHPGESGRQRAQHRVPRHHRAPRQPPSGMARVTTYPTSISWMTMSILSSPISLAHIPHRYPG